MTSSVTATFVFTDLVDSTATAARLGPDAAEELRQKHFRLLRSAVTASGGVEVKNLGDGVMVMFTSPSRALACAAAMQQAIEHHNRSAPDPRHQKKTNAVFCDGHVELMALQDLGYIVNADESVAALDTRATNRLFSGSGTDADPPPVQ